MATDTRDAVLMRTDNGERIGTGMRALPDWDRLQELAAEVEVKPLEGRRLEGERRILYTYSEFISGCCTTDSCPSGNADTA